MMRSPSNWAVAVRKPDGDIAQVNQRDRLADGAAPGLAPAGRPRRDRARRVAGDRLSRARDLGQLRGAGGEDEEGEEVETEITRGQLIFAFAIAIGFALLLFKVGPALLTDWIGIDATAGS